MTDKQINIIIIIIIIPGSDNVYGAVIMTHVISRVYPVHMTNVGQRQAAADPQTRPTSYTYFI